MGLSVEADMKDFQISQIVERYGAVVLVGLAFDAGKNLIVDLRRGEALSEAHVT